MSMQRSFSALAACLAVAGCSTMPVPANRPGAQYQREQRLAGTVSQPVCLPASAPFGLDSFRKVDVAAFTAMPDVLAPGDRLRLVVSGDKDVLTGSYVVGANGRLVVTDVADLAASGQVRQAVEIALRGRLLAQGLVRNISNNVRLQLEVAGAVPVSVEGAVFEPGNVRAGERGPDDKASALSNAAGGDFNAGRSLSTALRAAGGLRPDAAAGSVYLIRGDRYAVIDVWPAFGGSGAVDPQLAAGDRIVVPSAGCFQPELARPSSVTAPGIRVYMSNLSRPAASNASSAIGKESTSLPYGTRLLQGLVSANCVGGSALNAGRRAVLISRNPINGKSIAIERSVESLVRNADRDDANPYLMPNDAIACYDSTAMSVVDVIGLMGNLLGPVAIVKGLGN